MPAGRQERCLHAGSVLVTNQHRRPGLLPTQHQLSAAPSLGMGPALDTTCPQDTACSPELASLGKRRGRGPQLESRSRAGPSPLLTPACYLEQTSRPAPQVREVSLSPSGHPHEAGPGHS